MLEEAQMSLITVDSLLKDLNTLPEQLFHRFLHVTYLPMRWMFSDEQMTTGNYIRWTRLGHRQQAVNQQSPLAQPARLCLLLKCQGM
jgi:hypothetical protein